MRFIHENVRSQAADDTGIVIAIEQSLNVSEKAI